MSTYGGRLQPWEEWTEAYGMGAFARMWQPDLPGAGHRATAHAGVCPRPCRLVLVWKWHCPGWNAAIWNLRKPDTTEAEAEGLQCWVWIDLEVYVHHPTPSRRMWIRASGVEGPPVVSGSFATVCDELRIWMDHPLGLASMQPGGTLYNETILRRAWSLSFGFDQAVMSRADLDAMRESGLETLVPELGLQRLIRLRERLIADHEAACARFHVEPVDLPPICARREPIACELEAGTVEGPDGIVIHELGS